MTWFSFARTAAPIKAVVVRRKRELAVVVDRRQPAGGFVGRDVSLAELLEDAAAFGAGLTLDATGTRARVVAGREAESAEEVVEAADHGPIGETEFGLDVLDDAAVFQED